MENLRLPDDIVFGLDIGTRNIVGTVGYVDAKGGFKAAAIVSKEHETRAMLDGQIHDINKVGETILKVKHQLEARIGRPLTEVCIAAAGRVLKTIQVHEEFTFESETKVDSEQIYSLEMVAVEKAHASVNSDNPENHFYCVGYTTVKYYLNDYAINNLEGHKASKIGVDLIATFLPDEVVDSLYAAVDYAGLSVANLTLEPIAAMNVAIPEQYRLLNIGLVDVGAGTSDICLTRDGSIVAYGMIPSAGDEMTEIIAKEYLVDFAAAEKIKLAAGSKKFITYKDIIGISHKIPSSDVKALLADQVDKITKMVADKICELNGGKPVSAVFVVGGGGKFPEFTNKLAEGLGIAKERVALRGEEVLTNIDFLMDDVKKDPLLVTPIGICINYYNQKNNFIFATVNGERVKLFDNNHLTLVDAVMQAGIPNDRLFARRGEALEFSVNDARRLVRGYTGEPAVMLLNGKEANMNSRIERNDIIEITESTVGEKAAMKISELDEFTSTIDFFVNNKKVTCPKFVYVNNELKSGDYNIQNGDKIVMGNYYKLSQLLSFLDISFGDYDFYVNNVQAEPDTVVYENFKVDYKTHWNNTEQTEGNIKHSENNSVLNADVISGENEPSDITVIVNGTPVIMSGKSKYIFVDILDFYPFDIQNPGGTSVMMTLNGEKADFTMPLSPMDVIELRWIS